MALLVLAIGVLGFVALQYRAIEVSSEGENRIQAINIARDVAEKIRVNRTALTTYASTLAQTNITTLPTPNCFSVYCSTVEKAEFDSAFVKISAQRIGVSVNMFTCPDVENSRRCIYVAWGETVAVNANGINDCTTAGLYRPNSTCVVMEVY